MPKVEQFYAALYSSFGGVWCVHNPCHLGMARIISEYSEADVVTTHVKYGDQGITIHGWIINIIIKGLKWPCAISLLNSPLTQIFIPFYETPKWSI